MEGGLLDAPPLAIRTDPITDSYAVEDRPFARGKFASVRRCRHLASGAEFAAKSMRKRRRAADVRHEILHEAHVLRLSARHPRIVRMHEVFETPHEIVLVLELVAGGELQRVLDDEEAVEEGEAARLLTQVLEGVAFLHSHHIAHLDLKPQNLLLTQSFRGGGEVKLCDFGISRLISKGAEIREIVGTPDYVAPEVLHYEPISLPTDMWSVGVLTYVLLSGHSPFGGDSKQETFCNITRGHLDFPEELFAGTSAHAIDFVRRLLRRDPRERMTAEECLSHTWLTRNVHLADLTLSPEEQKEDSSETNGAESSEKRHSCSGGMHEGSEEVSEKSQESGNMQPALPLRVYTSVSPKVARTALCPGLALDTPFESRNPSDCQAPYPGSPPAGDKLPESDPPHELKIPLLQHNGFVSLSPKIARSVFSQSLSFQKERGGEASRDENNEPRLGRGPSPKVTVFSHSSFLCESLTVSAESGTPVPQESKSRRVLSKHFSEEIVLEERVSMVY